MPADAPPEFYLVVGLSHRAAPPDLRARLFVEDPDLNALAADVRAAGFTEAVVLATCERLEVVTVARDTGVAELAVGRLIAQWSGLEPGEVDALLSISRGGAALRHLFAVAAALDSQILGEPDILGQVKASHRAAEAAGLAGPALDAAFQAAYGVAKRVRNETALGERPVSLAAAAAQVALEIHGDLARSSVLLLGLGEVSELMAGHFRDCGVARLAVSHPMSRRAATVAGRHAAHVHPWEDLDAALAEADIVVAALGEGRYTITRDRLRRALKRRRQRPIFLVDAAVPGDIDPGVDAFDAAFRYDLADLERIAAEGLARRETAALDAWRIVDAELDAFQARRREREAVPAVVALREHAERLRAEVLSDAKLNADAATRRLLQRLLHGPTRVLRHAARESEAERAELEVSLRRLFALDETGQDGGGNSGTAPDSDDDAK